MPHVVESRILFGAADGSEGFYTPCSYRTRLRTLTRGYRRGTSRNQSIFGQSYGHVPATSPNVVTPLQIVLGMTQVYMSTVQDLIGELDQYIGASNASQPRDLWYQDDALLIVTATNVETAVSGLVTDLATGL